MKTAYQHVKMCLKKYLSDPNRNYSRMEEQIYSHPGVTEENRRELLIRARVALDLEEENRQKQREDKNKNLTLEQRTTRNNFWRVLNGLKPL